MFMLVKLSIEFCRCIWRALRRQLLVERRMKSYIDIVPTDLESPGESGKVQQLRRSGKLGNFVGDRGKIACIMRLINCCCNIGKLSLIIWIEFLLFILLFLN